MWQFIILIILAVLLMLIVSFKIWVVITTGRCTSTRRLDGKTVIVTGANCGLGFETAKALAARGGKVIMAVKDELKGGYAAQELAKSTGNASVRYELLNLASFKSIKHFVERINRDEEQIDILVNNAAMIGTEDRVLTEDGLEVQSQVNHFGPFLLTLLLLPQLRKSLYARIVVVSSDGYKYSKLEDFRSNFQGDINYDPGTIYWNTKLANILFTRELARRLKGSHITVNVVNPGIVKTRLGTNIVGKYKVMFLIVYKVFFFLLKSVEEGVQTTIYAAVDEEVDGVNGQYFKDCKLKAFTNLADDMDLAQELWNQSEINVGLKYDEINRLRV